MAEQKKQDTNQLLKVRREKLADLQANGKDPFQITKFDQTHHSLEVKELYEAHEAELLKDRETPDVEGLDEAQAREVLKKDYEERREIMDASPIHVAIVKTIYDGCLVHIAGFFAECRRMQPGKDRGRGEDTS